MTVEHLIAILQTYPSGLRVVRVGFDGAGYDDCALTKQHESLVEIRRVAGENYYRGDYDDANKTETQWLKFTDDKSFEALVVG